MALFENYEQRIANINKVLNDNGMSISPSIGLMSKSFQKLRKSRFYFKTSSSLMALEFFSFS